MKPFYPEHHPCAFAALGVSADTCVCCSSSMHCHSLMKQLIATYQGNVSPPDGITAVAAGCVTSACELAAVQSHRGNAGLRHSALVVYFLCLSNTVLHSSGIQDPQQALLAPSPRAQLHVATVQPLKHTVRLSAVQNT